jgi:hypothetical protein
MARHYLCDSGGMKGASAAYTCFAPDYDSGPVASAAGPSSSLYAAGPPAKKTLSGTQFLGNMKRELTSNASQWSKGIDHPTVTASVKDESRGGLLSADTPRARSRITEKVAVKTMEIAAGAKIGQQIFDDPTGLDAWETEPTALIVVNYCSEEEAERIINAGRVDLSGNPEGFLQQVPVVGNP